MKYEELPSKVVFTRKMGGKHKVRACICGNFEDEVATMTYAGGCDASQIRGLLRHAALQQWAVYGTDIKCAFLNAERKDKTKIIAMTIPYIYIKLGIATHQDVWLVDSAMYGLVTSPRDWSDHRDSVIPTMVWHREEGATKWKGSFHRAKDQHLWHLREQCLETGEVKNRGLMAIYVDDVLLAADDGVAVCALKAIASVWECADAEKATLAEAITFCGFEIQQNEKEHGGGYRLHQHSYETELVKKWNITEKAHHIDFKLPTPEEESELQRSEDLELVRQAQACTGALLWLATRTRPELSVGVAAMSRLCLKAPELTVSMGRKMMAYLRRPTMGMIYAENPGPKHGARDQLAKPRCERTVEACSDISYASTKGYRSVQGQVYFYAGAPIMWSTSRQPFPTQSTAESELVSLCEALVGGRATVSLVAALRDEPEERLVKRLWGDNAAAISLATSEGQGSWRTRHLRIRAAILRSALREEEWQLAHLMGRELVADSFTKIVNGLAFERALQDLCIKFYDNKGDSDSGGCVRQDQKNAKIAMLVGASLLSGASASNMDEDGDELSWFWTIGLILMCVGAVYISNKLVRSGMWLYNRLQGASGGCVGERAEELQQAPQVRALRLDSSDDDEQQLARIRANQERATYVPAADMDELRDMVTRSRRIEEDPHNKMHGRVPEDWHQDDSSQMPRRRKKKERNKKQLDSEEEEAMLEHARRNMLRAVPIRNVPDGSSSRPRVTRSGLHNEAFSSTSGANQSGYGEPSRSSNEARAMRFQSYSQSGSCVAAAGMISQPSSSQSGSCVAAAGMISQPSSSQSGSCVAAAGMISQPSSSQSGSCAAAAGMISHPSSTQSGSGNAAADRSRTGGSTNEWNDFQHAYQGRHWGSEKLRAEYWKFKATGKQPP